MPERVAVSTSTFVDLSHPIPDGLKIAKSLVRGSVYAPEIDKAMDIGTLQEELSYFTKNWKVPFKELPKVKLEQK